MNDRFKFRIPMFTDKGTFIEFQYLELGDFIECTLCGTNGEPQQCTGLKDKNEKLIYEGDIVKYAEYDWSDIAFKDWEQEIGKVVWGGNHDYPAFDLEKHNFECNSFAHIFNDGWTIEVIGNIYENKELLEVNNDR